MQNMSEVNKRGTTMSFDDVQVSLSLSLMFNMPCSALAYRINNRGITKVIIGSATHAIMI